MAFLENFDANKVEPNEVQQPVPAGDYLAMIIKTERKKTKSGSGEYLELSMKIQGGPQDGRAVKDRLNLWNQNEVARKIAWGDMSAICHAVGVMQPNDSNDLCNIPMMVAVAVTDPNEQGRQYNEIKGYTKRNTEAPAAAAAPEAGTSIPTWM